MKQIRKIGALVLAGAMMLAMSVTALAAGEANMTGESGVIGEFTTPDVATVQNDAVIIYKEITAYNPETVTVNAPAVTFNYTITPGSAGKGIYDASSHHNPAANAHAVTKAGVGTPTITGTAANVITLVPGTNTFNASVNGTANRFPLTVNFSSINWNTDGSGAGVYRYVITETTTKAVKNASGIAEGSGANVLYMDVYVDGSNQIYGYVLFTNNDDIDARTDDDAAASTAAGKTEGFVGSVADKTAYAEDTSVADKYYTYNLSVQKTVTNDTYTVTNKHQFPFELTLTNDTVTADVLPIMTINDDTLATQAALSAKAIAGSWTPTIASGGIITYTGIPTGTTVVIREQNDVTGVMYSSSSENADTNAERKDIYTSDWSNTATVNCNATALDKAEQNHTEDGAGIVIFTNNLLQISPTGVVLRVAPYILMLGAGIFLFLISRRRKNSADEA